MNESKRTPDFSSICYSIGCNNPATMTVRLPLNDRLSCRIRLCEQCLPTWSAKVREKGAGVEVKQR